MQRQVVDAMKGRIGGEVAKQHVHDTGRLGKVEDPCDRGIEEVEIHQDCAYTNGGG